jgi:hypothetical protein
MGTCKGEMLVEGGYNRNGGQGNSLERGCRLVTLVMLGEVTKEAKMIERVRWSRETLISGQNSEGTRICRGVVVTA